MSAAVMTTVSPAPLRLTGGDALVAGLKRWGVDTLFGMPGVQLDAFFDAIQRDGDIQVMHTRHEQGAAYMAFGAAASTGRPAVCVVVPGPGVLNAGAALSTAYACYAPVLCITSTIATAHLGRGHGLLHEIGDQAGYLRGLTKWYGRAESAAEIPALIDEAFRQLTSGQPRPVAIEVPPDVLAQAALFANATLPPVPAARPLMEGPLVDVAAIAEAAALLRQARYPAIVVGSGARHAGPAIEAIAAKLQAPVISRCQGRGVVADASPYACSGAAFNEQWRDVDVVIGFGTRLAQLREWGADAALQVIHVDIAYPETVRTRPPAVAIIADAAAAAAALLEALSDYQYQGDDRRNRLAGLKQAFSAEIASALQPQVAYLNAIRQALPDSGILVDEMTQIGYVARCAFPVQHPHGFISSSYQGTLGFGFATALGAQAANPQHRVVSVTGDGGFLFTMPELATAAQHGIPLITVLFADGYFGNVRRIQANSYGRRFIATELKNPDFLILARAFGIAARQANSPAELQDALADMLACDEPGLIVVPMELAAIPSPWPYLLPRKVR